MLKCRHRKASKNQLKQALCDFEILMAPLLASNVSVFRVSIAGVYNKYKQITMCFWHSKVSLSQRSKQI